MEDYRCTPYCNDYIDIIDKKNQLLKTIKKKHPKLKNIYSAVKKNDGDYKRSFMEIYSGKCAYCGISLDFATKRYFEIDHYIHKDEERFIDDHQAANQIENLVLSCQRCNRNKGDYSFPRELERILFPDNLEIKSVFKRNDKFEIVIAEEYVDNKDINSYYNKMRFGDEIHRLNYLTMSISGLKNKIVDLHPDVYIELDKALDILDRARRLLA